MVNVTNLDDIGVGSIARYGFTSDVVAVVGPAATPIWEVGLAGVHPVAGRTLLNTQVITQMHIENSTGAQITVWLEIGGAAVTVPYTLNNNESAVITFSGLNLGNNDIDINASAAGVTVQLTGVQMVVA